MSNIGTTGPEKQLAADMVRLLNLRDVDCRKVTAAKQVRTFARRLAADLGDDLSMAQAQLVQRAAVLAALLEDHEARFLLGKDASIGDYCQMASIQKQLLALLGLKRVARDITPSVADYIKHISGEAVE
jgi:hypothetical protein